jgi:hypothetical protein
MSETIHFVDVNLKVWNVVIHKSLGNEACPRLQVIPAQEGLAKFLHYLTFSPNPVAQSASRPATLSEPEFARPLLDIRLCPKMLFRGQDNGGGKMHVDQLDSVFMSVMLPGLEPARKP